MGRVFYIFCMGSACNPRVLVQEMQEGQTVVLVTEAEVGVIM